jgi:Ca2+-binding EF-hand superfamily protein
MIPFMKQVLVRNSIEFVSSLSKRIPSENEKYLAGLNHFQNFTEEELDQLFSIFDYNNDGTI